MAIDTQAEERKTGLATTGEAAEYLNVSRKTINNWIDDGTLPKEMAGTHRRTTWAAIYKMAERT